MIRAYVWYHEKENNSTMYSVREVHYETHGINPNDEEVIVALPDEEDGFIVHRKQLSLKLKLKGCFVMPRPPDDCMIFRKDPSVRVMGQTDDGELDGWVKEDQHVWKRIVQEEIGETVAKTSDRTEVAQNKEPTKVPSACDVIAGLTDAQKGATAYAVEAVSTIVSSLVQLEKIKHQSLASSSKFCLTSVGGFNQSVSYTQDKRNFANGTEE